MTVSSDVRYSETTGRWEWEVETDEGDYHHGYTANSAYAWREVQAHVKVLRDRAARGVGRLPSSEVL